jgi:hypothetical protein
MSKRKKCRKRKNWFRYKRRTRLRRRRRFHRLRWCLEREHQELKQRRRLELNDIDRQRILGLADDLPKLWRSDKTTDRDRKVLLRMLLQEVGVTQIDVPRHALRLRLLWHTQAVTDIEVDLPVPETSKKSPQWRVVAPTAPSSLEALR